MQIYIYKEDFFYNKILATSKSLVEEILKDKSKYYTKRRIPKKMVFVLSTALKKIRLYQKFSKAFELTS